MKTFVLTILEDRLQKILNTLKTDSEMNRFFLSLCFMKIKCLKFLLFIFILGCTKDNQQLEPNIPEYNPSLHSGINLSFANYVKKFYDEANIRGKNENNIIGKAIEDLKLEFDSDLTNYCGYALSFNTSNSPHVIISDRATCWNDRSATDKEILIFHELGHAILKRSHDDTRMSNNHRKTMMFSGNQFGLYKKEEIDKRRYYLDELFDVTTPEPNWAK